MSSVTRDHIAQLKQRSLRNRKTYDLDQHEMWTHVASELSREDLSSPTSSYTAVLVKRQRRLEQARAREVRVPPEANGLAVVRRASALWIEAFPSRAHVEASIAAVVADLLEEPAGGPETLLSPLARAESALAKVWMAEALAMGVPQGTSGDAFAVDGEGVAGAALLRDGRVAHLAVRVAF